MANPVDPETLARGARAAMAEKIRLPWWYVPVQGLALLGMIGAGVIDRFLRLGGEASGWIIFGALVVLLGGEWALWRSRGVSFSRRTMRAYPSTRAPGLAFLVVAVVGVVAADVLAHHHLPLAAVLALVAALASTVLLVRIDVARANDVREGRVAR